MFAKRVFIGVAAALVAVPTFLAAQQTIYKWVDKDGKTVFSDTPPPKEITTSTQQRAGGGFATASPQLPYATQIAMDRYPVTFYASGTCGPSCDQARALLTKRGIPFAERDPGTDPAAGEEVKKAIGTVMVPVLLIGEMPQKGFNEAAWTSALDNAGYPRTALPNQPNPRATPPPAPKKAPEPAAADAPAADAAEPAKQ
ncbi:hypothetical protein BWI17_05975 [Betaproteobacteria bacterium GR16-43]|nr:hypothetical protein BWI17_05975 [Betaproteobacteria bacterium GR16-43]